VVSLFEVTGVTRVASPFLFQKAPVRPSLPTLIRRGFDEGEGAAGARADADGIFGALPAEGFHYLGQALGCGVGLAFGGDSEDGVEEASGGYTPFIVAVGGAGEGEGAVLSGRVTRR
jgi:hypothetical protein